MRRALSGATPEGSIATPRGVAVCSGCRGSRPFRSLTRPTPLGRKGRKMAVVGGIARSALLMMTIIVFPGFTLLGQL